MIVVPLGEDFTLAFDDEWNFQVRGRPKMTSAIHLNIAITRKYHSKVRIGARYDIQNDGQTISLNVVFLLMLILHVTDM